MITTSSKQEFMKRLFKHNLREKLIAAVCTAVILLVAVCLKPVSKVYSVSVNAKISPDQELVSENIGRVEVKVGGNFFELRKIKAEDLIMNFDFSNEPAGEISLNIGDKELPAVFLPLDVKSVSPQTLIFRTEMRKVENGPETPATEEETVKEAADLTPGEGTVKENKEPAPVQTFHETSLQPEQPENGEKNE